MSATEPTQRTQPALTDPFTIGDVEIANRVLLAPLAGIGNWFVRLQAQPPRRRARRLRDGLQPRDPPPQRAHAAELLRIHPDEHPVSIQLFGSDPEVMRGAAGVVADAGADLIDLNMGCPVRKVRKTGAGAELLADPDLAVAVAAPRSREAAAGRSP